MPYKKPTKKFIEITRLLKGFDLNATNLSKVLECSIPTARKKLTNPEQLTLAELEKIHRKGHIEWDRIREAIKE